MKTSAGEKETNSKSRFSSQENLMITVYNKIKMTHPSPVKDPILPTANHQSTLVVSAWRTRATFLRHNFKSLNPSEKKRGFTNWCIVSQQTPKRRHGHSGSTVIAARLHNVSISHFYSMIMSQHGYNWSGNMANLKYCCHFASVDPINKAAGSCKQWQRGSDGEAWFQDPTSAWIPVLLWARYCMKQNIVLVF